MKVFFRETNGYNAVIITDGKTAKIYNGAPSGTFEGIDLYTENTAKQLKAHFLEIGALCFEDMHSDNEIELAEIKEELENAELVFDSEKSN